MIQKIPHEGDRIETGVVQFGNDWPGVFIRGDNAMWFSSMLDCALQCDEPPFLAKKTMESLRDLLRACSTVKGSDERKL